MRPTFQSFVRVATLDLIFTDLANAFAALLGPRPLYARTSSAMFDVGAGGSTDGFSRFTWALPHVIP